jgi:hypothetical protein
MKELAGRGAYLAEESYKVLQEKFNHTVVDRVPLILYSSHLHFEQTNTAPDFIPEGVGGFTEFLKGRVVIPFDGSMHDFKHVIRHELTHVFMYSKINRVLHDHKMTQDRIPPLWFTEGLAEFWSTEWDMQGEMLIRDAVMSNYIVPLNDMDRIFGTFLMYKEGQNLLGFLAASYGNEKVLQLMENFWMTTSFEEDFRITTGRTFKEFDDEWLYSLKKKYYPLLSIEDEPSRSSTPVVTEGFNSKPVYYNNNGTKELYFIGTRTGYFGIYRAALNRNPREPAECILEGERSDEFEAFHPFQSKIDISKDGILAFVTKSGETDALHLFNVKTRETTATLRFKDLVVIGSPSWAPDGIRIVFSAVDKSGDNDLYVWDTDSQHLTRLTNDLYDDRDPSWSPNGKRIVFSSDRTAYGEKGTLNLFIYDFSTQDISYLTCGKETYESPVWSPDGKSILCMCDLDSARNVWMLKIDSTGERATSMKKLTSFITAAFDPAWADSAAVFVAFENYTFQIRKIENIQAAYDSSKVEREVVFAPPTQIWTPDSLSGATQLGAKKYAGEYSLDIAESAISTDPVFGTYGGAFLSMSDILGNEEYDFLVYNTAQSQDELLTSFNVAISRISLGQRCSYAYGVFRFGGLRYDILQYPDSSFIETDFGGYFALSYPLSKFERLETATTLSNSNREIIEGVEERKALFLSNSISFIHDNSLWSYTGPIDGSRFFATLSYTSDIEYSNADYYSVIFDYRNYLRLGPRSAFASRFWLFYNDGIESRRFFMGGSWDLRGYPLFSIRGEKLWLSSQELRFPFLNQLALQTPFGGLAFNGIQGAAFFDAGNAWDTQYTGTLGSIGAGVRLNLAGYLVLRLDFGKRIENNFTTLESDIFSQFFFGADF